MTKSELRALRLRVIDGHALTSAQALQVVTALEDVAGYVERSIKARPEPFEYDDLPAMLRGLRATLRDAGPLEDA